MAVVVPLASAAKAQHSADPLRLIAGRSYRRANTLVSVAFLRVEASHHPPQGGDPMKVGPVYISLAALLIIVILVILLT
jgi:hypothetical protein